MVFFLIEIVVLKLQFRNFIAMHLVPMEVSFFYHEICPPPHSCRLVEVQETDAGKRIVIVRDFSREGMSITQSVNGVISTVFFSRQ